MEEIMGTTASPLINPAFETAGFLPEFSPSLISIAK
jgi:hypothetical protein